MHQRWSNQRCTHFPLRNKWGSHMDKCSIPFIRFQSSAHVTSDVNSAFISPDSLILCSWFGNISCIVLAPALFLLRLFLLAVGSGLCAAGNVHIVLANVLITCDALVSHTKSIHCSVITDTHSVSNSIASSRRRVPISPMSVAEYKNAIYGSRNTYFHGLPSPTVHKPNHLKLRHTRAQMS